VQGKALMSFGKTEYLEDLQTLFCSRQKYDLRDIKKVCLDIVIAAESRADSKNKSIICEICNFITNHNPHF
jgi:hypothetical protein